MNVKRLAIRKFKSPREGYISGISGRRKTSELCTTAECQQQEHDIRGPGLSQEGHKLSQKGQLSPDIGTRTKGNPPARQASGPADLLPHYTKTAYFPYLIDNLREAQERPRLEKRETVECAVALDTQRCLRILRKVIRLYVVFSS